MCTVGNLMDDKQGPPDRKMRIRTQNPFYVPQQAVLKIERGQSHNRFSISYLFRRHYLYIFTGKNITWFITCVDLPLNLTYFPREKPMLLRLQDYLLAPCRPTRITYLLETRMNIVSSRAS